MTWKQKSTKLEDQESSKQSHPKHTKNKIYLNISVVNLFICKTTHHPDTFNIGMHKEEIRFLFLSSPVPWLQKQLVYFNLIHWNSILLSEWL